MIGVGISPAEAASSMSIEAVDRTLSRRDLIRLMEEAHAHGRVRQARKTKAVDARPAVQGEIVVTIITPEGKETQSRPAEAGDWVVRNRCPETGNEQYLVKAAKFVERYQATERPAAADGWREFRPLGRIMRFFEVRPEDGRFAFEAPWGEKMLALPGDAILQDPDDPNDVYCVAAASFRCTHEVLD